MTLRPKLKSDDKIKQAKDVVDRKISFETDANFGEYTQNLQKWDIQWRGAMARTNKPWSHASEYNPPITFSRVEDVHSLLFSYFQRFDFFSMAAVGGQQNVSPDLLRKRAQDLTDTIRWSLQNESNSLAFLDGFIHNGLQYGSAYGYLPWRRHSRNVRSEMYVPDEVRQNKKLSDVGIIREAMGERLLTKKPKEENGTFHVRMTDDDGEEKEATVWIDRENPYRPEGEPVLIVERESLVYNAPRPKIKASYDMMIPADASGIQTARRMWVRDFMTMDEVEELVSSTIFNTVSQSELEDLRKLAKQKDPGLSSPDAGEQDAVDYERDAEGMAPTKLTKRTELFEIISEYAFEDIDGDNLGRIHCPIRDQRTQADAPWSTES